MIAGLDSATPPTSSQLAQAKAAGVRLWGGYLTTKPHVNILHPWTQANFARVKAAGLATVAYCSGLDDAAACKQRAAEWGVPLCLDVESGIHGDGAWVQGWLDKSDAGLYGNGPVFAGRKAAFYVLARYTSGASDPKATWSTHVAKPSGPCGWQWQGTHTEFGAGVDSCWFDDWFATGHAGAAVDPWVATGGTFSRDPVLAQNQDGRLEAVVCGENGHLYGLAQTAPGGEWWDEWVDLGAPAGGAPGSPAVARSKSGCLTILVRGKAGKVGHRTQEGPGGALSDWASLGGDPRKRDPIVVVMAGGHLHAFVVADDGRLFALEQGGAEGAWGTDWEEVGDPPPSGAAGRLVARQQEDGRLELLLRGANGKIFHRTQQKPGGPFSSDWEVLRAEPGHNDPALAQHKDGRLHAFVIGDDGHLHDVAQAKPNGPWAPKWKDRGGPVPGGAQGRLAAVRNADGRLELFVRGKDGRLYHRAQEKAGGDFAPKWAPLGGKLAGNPVVQRNADGRLEVFAVGKDSRIQRAAQTAPGRW